MFSIRSDVEYVDPAEVPLWVLEIDDNMYGILAILTVLIYDIITTMDKEVKYFWVSRLTSCVMSNIPLRFTDILYMRVMALFSPGKRLDVCLRAMFAIEGAFMLGVLIYGTSYEGVNVTALAEGITVCAQNRIESAVWITLYWTAPMTYESILMALALYKAAEIWRISAGFHGFSLVRVLVQDQALYFIMIIACGAAKIISFQPISSTFIVANLLNTIGSASFFCVLGSRLLVHLKEAGERGVNGGTSYRATTMGDMEFA
ncbi:hypothetical protein DFH11DRAFT_1516989 [Phellopilus nigrolimitatus]|nr:hypothetical protein DFH11DRAFT_1516989 [Phellopilus nigrolimitatus]